MKVISIFLSLATLIAYVFSMLNGTIAKCVLCGLLAIAWAISELEMGDKNEKS